MRTARTEFTFDQSAALDESLQRAGNHGDAEVVALGDVLRRERTVRARIAKNEIADGIFDRLQISLGESLRKRNAESVAISRRIFDREISVTPSVSDEPGRVGAPHTTRSLAHARDDNHATLLHQFEQCLFSIDHRSRRDFVERQISDAKQQIVNGVDAFRFAPFIEMLQFELGAFERIGVEQFAQLRFAEELTELRLING